MSLIYFVHSDWLFYEKMYTVLIAKYLFIEYYRGNSVWWQNVCIKYSMNDKMISVKKICIDAERIRYDISLELFVVVNISRNMELHPKKYIRQVLKIDNYITPFIPYGLRDPCINVYPSKLYNMIHITILIYNWFFNNIYYDNTGDKLIELLTVYQQIISFLGIKCIWIVDFFTFWPFCILFRPHKFQNDVITQKQNVDLIE